MNENNTTAGAAGMNEFFTRGKANEGIQVPLWRPDGTKSEHWVRILGIDSDIFRQADAESRREAIKIAQLDSQAEKVEAIARTKRRLIASLVTAWSFPGECTTDAVEQFFIEAPQIMDAIDTAASKRSLFFAIGSSNSQPSPSTSSDST
ncbi:hypothetical protein JTY56_gp28 [Xanthomonas phage Bosa]|uniref:Uncharacterized protein n=2 Tax=Bosavirus TaxID=2946834 RepID=A0A679KAQ2_9CAUD|nr:hypothetical protein JTY56_gp28 [Xanthomonas phage Bosa]YP_010739161.1 hypothetical protein P9A54_gp29 [Xanthomonas phage vB_Xar_IVIA-DoCa10]ATS92234.1 hypothetical protein [Stenotrophomonas phage DLP4]UYA99014.1 hypothetical protein IVIADoCa10_29 [Xanthomonas phage vB_Xar_IVIA-DoCa10]CAA2409832.1 hypothetical protein [Xanthomonas phage Bosa]